MRNLMEFNKVKGAPAVPVPLGDYVIPLSGIVNCAPARRYVWPVAVPAQAWVRARAGRRGDVFLLRRRGLPPLKGEVSP